MIGLGTKLLAESQWENTDLFRSNEGLDGGSSKSVVNKILDN